MRRTLFLLLAAATLGFGCSKKAAAPEVAETAAEGGKPAAAPAAADNPMVASGLDELNRKVQQQQYEAAVGSIVAMSQLPKSEAQEAQFRARLRETEAALLRKAQQGDPAAQQSADMLGRMMTGR